MNINNLILISLSLARARPPASQRHWANFKVKACEGILEINDTPLIPAFPRKRDSRNFSRLPPVPYQG